MNTTRTVNDAIIEAFTRKAVAQFEGEKRDETGSGLSPVMKRGAHPKHHGVVRATFTVLPDLPDHLRVGLFRHPQPFPAYVRFSNSGREPRDQDPDAHGMAVKLLGVPDQGILDDERSTHDFVMVDAPVFLARSPEDFAEFLFLGGKRAAAPPAEQVEILKEIIRKFPNVATLKKVIPSPLTVPYWSQVPYALGDGQAVKYKCVPRVVDMTPPTGTLDADYLRLAMRQRLAGGEPVLFDFMVQVGKPDMPIDDPTVEWSETVSKPEPVAVLAIPVQAFESDAQMLFAENISYNPSHASAAHRPLGRINAAREAVYRRMQAQRHEANHVASREPTGTNDF